MIFNGLYSHFIHRKERDLAKEIPRGWTLQKIPKEMLETNSTVWVLWIFYG